MQDHYEINVAVLKDRGYTHYCKITLPDSFEDKAVDKLKELRELFGDGYKLDMTKWEARGYRKEEWEAV